MRQCAARAHHDHGVGEAHDDEKDAKEVDVALEAAIVQREKATMIVAIVGAA